MFCIFSYLIIYIFVAPAESWQDPAHYFFIIYHEFTKTISLHSICSCSAIQLLTNFFKSLIFLCCLMAIVYWYQPPESLHKWLFHRLWDCNKAMYQCPWAKSNFCTGTSAAERYKPNPFTAFKGEIIHPVHNNKNSAICPRLVEFTLLQCEMCSLTISFSQIMATVKNCT